MATDHPFVAPTLPQERLYTRLRAQFGRTPEWPVLTKARQFQRMTPHRAAHHLQLLIETFTGRKPLLSCSCPDAYYPTPVPRAAESQHKHPVGPGARDVQHV